MINFRQYLSILVFFMAGVMLICPSSQAGLFDVSLGLDIYGSRDDNILLMTDAEKSVSSIDPIDEILQIRPQIKVNYMGTRSSMKLRYELFKEWYNRYHPLDRTPTSYTDGSILLGYELTKRLTLGFFDNYRDSLYGTDRAEIPDIRDDYTQNTVEPSLKYSDIGERWTMSISGRWSYLDYDSDPILIASNDYGFADWDEFGGQVNLSLNLRTRTQFLVNTGIWNRSYDSEVVASIADNKGYSLYAGIDQKLGEGISLKVLCQYFHLEYAGSESTTKNRYDDLGGSITFSDQFSGITRLEIGAFSRFDESERISSAFYRNTGINMVFYTQMSERIETGFLCSFSRLKYDNIDQTWSDDYFQAGVKLGYIVAEWMSIRGQYIYSRRDSGGDFGDYDNNLFSIYLQFRHNLLY